MDNAQPPEESLAHAPSVAGSPAWSRLIPRLVAWPARVRVALTAGGLRSAVLAALELLAITLWALVVTQAYLNLDPLRIPTGREFLSVIQSHHLWTWVQQCGACALWNGSLQGGAPALVELHGSPLHPVVIVTTLLFGVVNGAKLALVAAFIMAGFAQWWLARILGLGRVARVWSACMAVAAGHLAPRMETGLFGVVFSTAACTLVLPPLLLFYVSPTRRRAVGLGVALALAIVSGQGYVQIALGALLVMVSGAHVLASRSRLAVVRSYALAALLAALLAAVFLVPFLHFAPYFVKNTDPGFGSNQPLQYLVLNLLISDVAFYGSELLQKLPYIWLHSFYIGWIPLLLALWAVYRYWFEQRNRLTGLLAVCSLVMLWLATGDLLQWLTTLPVMAPFTGAMLSVRYPPLFLTLVVPMLLALAAQAVDGLLRLPWRSYSLTIAREAGAGWSARFRLRWLMALPLMLVLFDLRAYSALWLATYHEEPAVRELLELLRTPDLQWVNPPFGEHYFIEPGVGMGLKLHEGVRQWGWRDRPPPRPVLEVSREDAIEGMERQASVNGVQVFTAPPGQEYAAVTHADGSRSICSAAGVGGTIDVTCVTTQPGVLELKENSWTGWGARVNGQPVSLRPSRWLSADVPAGTLAVQLRYRPWDVPLGAALSLSGVALAVALWRRPAARAAASQPGDDPPR